MRTLLVHQGEKPLIGILEDGQLAEVFFPQEGDTAEAVLCLLYTSPSPRD